MINDLGTQGVEVGQESDIPPSMEAANSFYPELAT